MKRITISDMNPLPLLSEARTERLYLRRWREEDAMALVPILEANAAHLSWIPAHVAAPGTVFEIAQRLAGFTADFDAGRAWRLGIFSRDEQTLFGEISLFPRSEVGRVPIGSADRLEIGYWLKADVTGRGYATEAARALIGLASKVRGVSRVEIRCDPANERSAAVPRRLGFRVVKPPSQGCEDTASTQMVWVLPIDSRGRDE